MPGTLHVVATPLGNLEDLSPRAARVLGSVACVACEDTRRTGRMLARLGIEARRTVSCHKFNERARLEPILRMLRRGEDVALVSDGGTPGISDPGSVLVRAALDEGIRVCPVPGPSAVAAILSAAGLPADRFVFEGFLPHRAGERRRRLRELRDEPRTVVVFETPHRIREALRDLESVFGERRVVLGREITKLHETVIAGSASEVLAALGEETVRGEIAIAVQGASPGRDGAKARDDASRLREAWREALAACPGDRRSALRRAARSLGLDRSELYRRLAEIGEDL